MKKVLIITCLLFTSLAHTHAQYQHKNFKAGIAGLPLFGNSSGVASGFNGLAIKGSIGCFFMQNWAIDMNLNYAQTNSLTLSRTDARYDSYSIVPTVKYYPVNRERLRAFVMFGAGLGTIRYQSNEENPSLSFLYQKEQLSGGISVLNIGLGAEYFFHPKWGIELSLPYIQTNNLTEDTSSRLYSGFAPTLGVVFAME